MDIYSTRAQLAALQLMPPEYTFLYDTFCADGGVVEDDRAIYDFRKGIKRMAPVVHRGVGGVLMDRDGYETREIGFCKIAPERIVTMDDISHRAFGEEVLGGMTPEQRSKKLLAQDLQDMRAAIQRRREHMALQVLLTGKLNVFEYTNEGRDAKTTMVADYGFTQFYTPDTAWNAAGAKIYDDMQAMLDIVYDSMGTVDIMVMDPNAASAMIHDEDMRQTLDMKNANLGEFNARYNGQGVRFLGTNADGIQMFVDSGKFLDDDNVIKPCLPAGTVIMGSRGMLKAVHGPITLVEGLDANAQHKTYITREVPQRIGSSNSDAIKNRLISCPTIVPFNVDGWVVANVL